MKLRNSKSGHTDDNFPPRKISSAIKNWTLESEFE